MEAGGGLWRPGGAAAWWRWQPGGGWWSLVEAWLKAGGGLVGGWWRPGGAVAWWRPGGVAAWEHRWQELFVVFH